MGYYLRSAFGDDFAFGGDFFKVDLEAWVRMVFI